MAKKRLSDLLREEANKSADDAGQAPQEESAEQSAETSSDSKSSQSSPAASEPAQAETPAAQPTGEPLRLGVHPSQQDKQEAEAETETSTAETTPTDSTSRRHSPTKADLESTINQLKTELAAAQQQLKQQETQFTQQIDRLQAEVKRQQSTIDQLQTESQHSQSLKAELEEARQVILKLSEINAKPVDAKYASKDSSQDRSHTPSPTRTSQDRNGANPAANAHPPAHLYVKAGESQPVNPATAKPAISKSGMPIMPAPSNSAEPELESKPVQFKMPGQDAGQDAGKLAPPAKHQQELRRILDHPTRPGSLPSMPTPSNEDKKLSETDMGWVD